MRLIFPNRTRLRKRKKAEENSDKSEDGSLSKDGQDKAGSDEEEAVRIPSKFDLAVDTTKIEKGQFTSVRDFFGEDEAVYIMDAKTTGNIGRYLNVNDTSKCQTTFNFRLFNNVSFLFHFSTRAIQTSLYKTCLLILTT